MNALDFEILDEKEMKKERATGKEVQKGAEGWSLAAPPPERENWKEERPRPGEREREREYEPERGGMEMGI